MRMARCPGILLSAVVLLTTLLSAPALPEEGRRGYSAEGRRAAEEISRPHEDDRRDERRSEDRKREEPVTAVEDVANKRDIATEPKQEFLTAAELLEKIKAERRREPEGNIDPSIRRKVDKTIDRISRKEMDNHENDGAIFQNRENLLPEREKGYYREYVYRQDGATSPGSERIVVGREGEIYYTPDHYRSFQKVK